MSKRIGALLAALLIVGVLAPAGASARTVERRPLVKQTKAPELTFVADDDLYKSFVSGRISEARYALERARSLFKLGKTRARYGSVARVDSNDATFVLRDLVVRLKDLEGSDLSTARAILARPSEPDDEFSYAPAADLSTCTATFCVHWASEGDHAPDLSDASGNSIPDWIDSVVQEFEHVVGDFAGELGYQPVKSDMTSPDNGGSGLPDIYLANIGDQGLYGFCTTDDPNAENAGGSYAGFDFSGYCVLDDDYSASEFPFNTPLENMQVTAAHEFFHAVQFGYDGYEDRWFLESTAAWVEDVLYDDVNDNYQYLSQSAITYPDVPIDYADPGGELGLIQYGGWLYFRYLTELLANGSPDNDLIREMWERAAARAGQPDPDDYSVLAIENVLDTRGYDFADVFGDFAAFNWVIELFYEEGVGYFDWLAEAGFPTTPYVVKNHKVTKNKPKTGKWQYESFHLSTANVTFKPGKGVKSNAKLQVKVDGPGSATMPEARYIVFYKTGLPEIFDFPLDGSGAGKKKLPFGKGSVSFIALALTNSSTRYLECYQYQTPFACGGGIPQDDGAVFTWTGTLKQ